MNLQKYTIQTGGRLNKFRNNKILFSLGTAESVKDKAQNLNYLEGKIIAIDKSTKKFEIMSLGHRNPQDLSISLLIQNTGKGGDEIVILAILVGRLHLLSMMVVTHIRNHIKNMVLKFKNFSNSILYLKDFFWR